MLARVKWSGDRAHDGKQWNTEHGTLLGFVYAGHQTLAMIACDGHDQYTRGKIIQKEYQHITVTTWFKWLNEEGAHA